MDPELARILANVQYMVSEDATEGDLNEYLKEEGYTLESLNSAVERAETIGAAEQRVTSGGNAVTDFLHMAAEGATLGFGDKLAGLGAAVIPGGKGYKEGAEQFQQRTDDLQLLAPGASKASSAAGVVGGAAALRAGLAPAVNAIRVARGNAVRLTPAFGGQVVGLPRASALQALRTFVKNPWVRRAATLATGGVLGSRL